MIIDDLAAQSIVVFSTFKAYICKSIMINIHNSFLFVIPTDVFREGERPVNFTVNNVYCTLNSEAELRSWETGQSSNLGLEVCKDHKMNNDNELFKGGIWPALRGTCIMVNSAMTMISSLGLR